MTSQQTALLGNHFVERGVSRATASAGTRIREPDMRVMLLPEGAIQELADGQRRFALQRPPAFNPACRFDRGSVVQAAVRAVAWRIGEDHVAKPLHQ